MITNEDIIKIAKLSKLHIDDNELQNLTSDMEKIIQFADEIKQAHDKMEEIYKESVPVNIMRDDNVVDSYSREKILKNVDGGQDGFFHIKKYR